MDVKGRMSLRESFMDVPKKSVIVGRARKLKGVRLFRTVVRRVLLYNKVLTEVAQPEETTDEAKLTIKVTETKKVERKSLTVQDRSILFMNPEDRTSVECTYILELFKKFGIFRKYPEHLQEALAGVCYYQYLEPDKIIVKQDRESENLYFVVSGEVSLSRVIIDRWTNEPKTVDMGVLKYGDMFGEVALLHNLRRSATMVTKTMVELIVINHDNFDEILRPNLMKEWGLLQDALINFNYFKGLDERVLRECCILSKVKEFQTDEVLLGDGKGMVQYVHFLLEGECQLIEHIIVREKHSVRGVHYKLYDPEETTLQQTMKSFGSADQNMDDPGSNATLKVDAMDSQKFIDYTDTLLTAQSNVKNVDPDRSSIITATLFDVITQWHKTTDVAEMLLREPSSISQQCYPTNVRTIFMQICTFRRGACFGLGENMADRRIVSKTNSRCLLVPRYWINEHNRANIWERVRLFMDSKFPSKQLLFKKFVKNRRWRKYKNDLADSIRRSGRRAHTNVTVHDVPYSIRIVNDIYGDT